MALGSSSSIVNTNALPPCSNQLLFSLIRPYVAIRQKSNAKEVDLSILRHAGKIHFQRCD